MKVKFIKPLTVIKPGSGAVIHKGIEILDDKLAKKWQDAGYLEIVEEKSKLDDKLEIVEEKSKRVYSKKVDKVEKVEQDV